jgi:UDP-glucuronate 4-epimerase
VFNNGNMERDFTYIDDIVEGVVRVVGKVPEGSNDWVGDKPDPAISYCPYRIYNIGNNRKEKLLRYIQVLEDCLGKRAEKNFLPMQPGDVPATYADVDDLVHDFDYKPNTTLEHGINQFVRWYKEYYRV